MRTYTLQISILALSLIPALANGQGVFQNLNFERANPISSNDPNDSYAVTPASALPGWSALIGNTPVSEVQLNTVSTGAASIDLLSQSEPSYLPGVIDGNYSVYLQPGPDNSGNGSYTASIAQTHTVPGNAASLMFDAWQPVSAIPFSVSLGGNILLPNALSTGQGPTGQPYTVYGVNVASYDGQSAALNFTAYPGNYNSLLLDDITFSTTPVVPEPSVYTLTVMAGIFLGARRLLMQRS
jgi:hypothetical protein